MYAGKTSAILFNAQVIPADKWEIDLSVESMDNTTISILRDAGITGLLADQKPIWSAHGIPVKKISGNVRTVKGTIHGFYKTQAAIPSICDVVSITMRLTNLSFFVASECLITNVKMNTEVKSAVEFDIEWESIGEVDYRGRL